MLIYLLIKIHASGNGDRRARVRANTRNQQSDYTRIAQL